MKLLSISLRNMRERALSTTLTTLSIAVGAGLLAALWLMIGEADRRYRAQAVGFDVVVGAKEGAPLPLVLNTVFNLGMPTGVLPMSVYEDLHSPQLKQKGTIRYAIPTARGDNYKNFPIVGTTDELFTKFQRGKDKNDQPIRLAFDRGRSFVFGHEEFLAFAREVAANGGKPPIIGDGHDSHAGHEAGPGHTHSHGTEDFKKPSRWHEAVIGATVARTLRMKTGDVIYPVHGLADDVTAHVHAKDGHEVVGVLAQTGTAIDRSIYIPLKTFLSMDKHEAIPQGAAAEVGNVQLTAVIVGCMDPSTRENLRYEFQGRRDAQAAVPLTEVEILMQIIGNVSDILRVVSYLVIVVAAVSIMVALYNTMNERRSEIAIMRSTGATRLQIVRIILQEALLVSLGGAILGVAMCRLAVYLLNDWIEAKAGVSVTWQRFSIAELWLILGVGFLGAFAGLLPALKCARTQVADHLPPTF